MDQVLHYLDIQPGLTMLDATLGRGGHAAAIIPRLGPTGHYIGLDVDPGNLDFARNRLQNLPIPPDQRPKIDLIHANFANMSAVLRDLAQAQASELTVHRLLADLGFASNQMDDPQRGFSFAADGPLDMRLDPRLTTTAADLVNTLDQQDLADLIYRYGEERRSRPIARKIAENRAQSPIKTTSELARIVRAAFGPASRNASGHRIHPATRTFMALRIAVNQELDVLESLLRNMTAIMAPASVGIIISFHSLEDRIVKQTFNQWASDDRGKKLTRKVVTADEYETQANPRSRSAKLRAFKFQ